MSLLDSKLPKSNSQQRLFFSFAIFTATTEKQSETGFAKVNHSHQQPIFYSYYSSGWSDNIAVEPSGNLLSGQAGDTFRASGGQWRQKY